MNIDQNCVNNKKVTFWLAVPNNVSQLAIIANILYVLYLKVTVQCTWKFRGCDIPVASISSF